MDDILQSENDDKPEIAKEIDAHRKPSETIPLEIPFQPYNHTTSQVPVDTALGNFGVNYGGEKKEKPGYFEGTLANFEKSAMGFQFLHGGYERAQDFSDSYKDPNFNPLQFQDKFLNVNPEYQPYLLSSENEKQMDFRLNRIHHEQWLDETVKNGSWMQWITGGGVGLATDLALMRFVPTIATMKYASLGKTAGMALVRNAPGAVAFGVSSSGAEQIDKINGNMKDFMNDSIIRSVFGTALFGASPVLSITTEKLNLWKMQSYVSDAVKGIGYKFKVGDKGELTGLEAYDMTPNKTLSADVVKLAQDKADSSFYKGGLFKLPYIGEAAEKLMGNTFFGSTVMSMLLSPLKTVALVADLTADHGIITQSLAEGKAKPIPFFSLLGQTYAHIRQEQAQYNALFSEFNRIKTKSYVSQSLQQAGMYTKQKTLEKIQGEIGDRPYKSYDEFNDAVQSVIRTEEPHENAAVNEAASMYRTSMDKYYAAWRKAYNLPEDWMPTKTARAYLMRVYDLNYLNNNLGARGEAFNKTGGWIPVISNELRKQDNIIIEHTAPITRLQTLIDNATDHNEINALKAQKKASEEILQNNIRTNPDLHLVAEDWNALSADEAKELIQITKPRDILQKEIDKQKTVIQGIKDNISKAKAGEIDNSILEQEETKLAMSQKQLDEENAKLQELAHSGKMNHRFYFKPKESHIYQFKDPNERLKLRKTYHQQEGYIADEETAHGFREDHAKAYYDTIMNQTAEDTINQIMGKFTGNRAENHTKQRTLNIPDEILYKYNFLTKNLPAKVANYKIWLARRTHLQNVFQGMSIDGGFEPIIKEVNEEFDKIHSGLNQDKVTFTEKLANKNLKIEEKKKLEKALVEVEKNIKKIRKDFNRGKEQVQFAYEKMMGISKLSKKAKQITQGIKAFNVFANLPFLVLTMVTDLSANGLKQGFMPFIQSGIYPTVQSLAGLLKTHDSYSLRNTAGALNLALHHIGNSTASRQIDLSTNPYLNLGRIPAALDKIAHFSSNFNLSTSIDNGLQYITSAIAQSNVISHMQSFVEGKLSRGDRLWLNKYGLDPEKDAERILAAFKKDGGGTNKLGGYQSNFWHWEDLETANKVSDAVFRSTHDTIISANALDAPIWLDENGLLNFMAPIIRGFKGWAFASLNRYLIPSLQTPDAHKLMSFAFMSATAGLVSPSRRIARGQEPYADKNGNQMTPTQIVAEILLDSPQLAWIASSLQDANMLSGGSLLGDLKNDKYRDRSRIGVMGPTFSNANKLFNFIDAMATGNMNEHDTMGMASMIPVINSLEGYNATQHLVQNFGLPKYRAK